MKKCKACQTEIDSKATKCPHCQADQRGWFKKHPILTIILALFILGIIGSASKGGSTTAGTTTTPTEEKKVAVSPKPIEYIKITASKLYAAYEENAIKADEMYKDKMVEVSGLSGSISKDITNTMYVTIKTDNIIGSVQCYLPESEKQKAMDLKPDTQIVVHGRNSGKMMNILIKDCTIVSN
jgi:hypothetical protein